MTTADPGASDALPPWEVAFLDWYPTAYFDPGVAYRQAFQAGWEAATRAPVSGAELTADERARFLAKLEELHPATWHHCDIEVRIDGETRYYEGDWLKDLWYALRRFLPGGER